jgi:dTMP kinase
MTGKFVVFEGIEGSGKSSCLKEVSKYLTEKNIPHIKTEEPNEKYGIRNLIKVEILSGHIEDPLTALFAHCLDRELHLKNEIIPALAEGLVVLCDRYLYSTIAYQGYAQGLPMSYVKTVQNVFMRPDLTLILDLPAEVALERMLGREIKEKYDNINSLKVLREAYLDIVKTSTDKFKILDATLPRDKLAQQAIKAINEVLGL